MRRFGLVLCAALALFAGACGGGGDDDKQSASAEVNAGVDSDAAGAAARAAASEACDGREAVNFAATYAQALGQTGNKDYRGIAAAIRKAADAAPSEINADFHVVADAVGPFLEVFAQANGNYMALASDPEFQAKAEKVGSDEVQQASQRVNDWFAKHCS